ncbi:MAG: signal peptidase I [Ruminococcus sp.]|nr:signal peptidase I [Ruminococcus sp.]
MRKIKNIFSAIILIATFVLVAILLLTKISGKTPEVFGFQLLRISSESMEPELSVGEIILSRTTDDVSLLAQGDIITYKGEQGSYSGKLITHRIIVAPHEENGEYRLQTMGDSNEFADPEIRASQVVGKMVCRVGFLSVIYSFFITPWGLMTILGFLAFLFINELYALRQLVKENGNEEDKTENLSSQIVADDEADS